jgi:hypothetical protein
MYLRSPDSGARGLAVISMVVVILMVVFILVPIVLSVFGFVCVLILGIMGVFGSQFIPK